MAKKKAKRKNKSLSERVQDGIIARIEALKTGQIDRAGVIEAALKDYERNIRIRSVGDYVALSQHQRRVLGLTDKAEIQHSGALEVTWLKS